tara:strand:- start:143 stop:805 length:663 start_codon:yes stop_codon:yes gene_type:complete
MNNNYDTLETQFVIDTVRPGDTVLDLGAHVGYYSFLMASLVGKNGKVFSFEPQLHFFELIQSSIRENRYEDIIVAEQCCLSNRTYNGKIAQHYGHGDYGCTYLMTAENPDCLYDDMTIESANVLDLGGYSFPSPIKFMKIDIEGSEYLALEAFKDRVKKDKPVILSEVNRVLLAHVSEVSTRQLIKLVQDCGYKCYVLGNETEEIDDILTEAQNVIFVPR